MEKKQKNTANVFVRIGKTLWRWTKRMFWGASKELSDDEKFAVEKIESPSMMAVKAFFRRKLAVVALVVLVCMFLLVFIGPLVRPMDLNYTDALQANMAPNYTLLEVPKGLAGNVKDINGFANFTVGVSKLNTLYVWGVTTNNLTNVDMTKTPDAIKPGNVRYAAAGSDHAIAVTVDGKVVGWGNNTAGQYGQLKAGDEEYYVQMPDVLLNGTIDATQVQQLVCGYQASALVMKDGTMYMWGNKNAMLTLKEFVTSETMGVNVQKVALSNYYAVMLYKDGTVSGGSTMSFNMLSAFSSKDGQIKNLAGYLSDKKVVDIAATNNCYALVLSDGSIVAFGAAEYGEKDVPALSGDKYVSVKSGTRHFVALTESGKAVCWGHNDGGQLKVDGKEANDIFTGAKQTYLVDEDGQVTDKCGFKGYLFGTDNRGRDILTRIIHGGKMTMTIGAVAVIVSTIIAIIIGCLSGYFGGWVDMLLMRFTEICSSIPFLPFAMMLSYVIQTMPISETTRIFIIMVMLGLLSWTGLARMIRAQVLAEREKEFVLAAKSMGIKEVAIAFKHILPNVISIILVNVTLDFAGCLLTESSLSYLGFGVQQPRPTWGNMLDGANNSLIIQNYWWQWVFPALFLAIATISINIIGDTLRDVLDPKSSREK